MIAITTGRRCTALLILALVFCAYGIGLVVGYQPTFSAALHLPTTTFGWLWIASGIFMTTGVLVEDDRWHFTLATGASAAWGLLLATHWTSAQGWAAAMSWIGVCLLSVLISYWPERPVRVSAHIYLDNQAIDARIKRLEEALVIAGIELPAAEGKDSQDGSEVSSRPEAE